MRLFVSAVLVLVFPPRSLGMTREDLGCNNESIEYVQDLVSQSNKEAAYGVAGDVRALCEYFLHRIQRLHEENPFASVSDLSHAARAVRSVATYIPRNNTGHESVAFRHAYNQILGAALAVAEGAEPEFTAQGTNFVRYFVAADQLAGKAANAAMHRQSILEIRTSLQRVKDIIIGIENLFSD